MKTDTPTPRYRVEERSGIVAVYDTQHPQYEITNGCHGDYPWVVASWSGIYDKEAVHWDVEAWKVEKAHALVRELNAAKESEQIWSCTMHDHLERTEENKTLRAENAQLKAELEKLTRSHGRRDNNMNKEAQRIAIAEACGWTECYFDNILNKLCGYPKGCNADNSGCYVKELPDYLNDLNAMHAAEKTLDYGHRCFYCEHLYYIIPEATISLYGDRDYAEYWELTVATASQRAEAFLRTLNLWKCEKEEGNERQ